MNSNKEKHLIYRIQKGDKEALGELWDTLTPKIFGYLVNTVRNKTIAEDILQTVWLKAIGALPKFKQRGIGISSWFFAIARNECHQYWRKSNKETSFDINMHDQSFDHRKEYEDKILIQQILSPLSEDDREIIKLRYIADLSLGDISKVLGINSISVRVRLHRALSRVRSKLNSI